MSKWMKVDPATLKVGDEARWVVEITGGRVIREVVVSEVCPRSIRLGLAYIAPGNGTWYVAKPKKAKPPTRPDEPPVGSFFRVDRTGELYLRMHEGNGDYGYVSLLGDREGDLCTWTDITDHGDTITLLELTEKGDKKDGGV
jgi:hypothetical protein